MSKENAIDVCVICKYMKEFGAAAAARNAHYRPKKRQVLCDDCDRDIPNKVSNEEFCRIFYGRTVYSHGYEGYLDSKLNVYEYRQQMISECPIVS